jgi:autotransporter-associated beta strand protein
MLQNSHMRWNRRRASSHSTRSLRVELLDDRTLPSVSLAYVDDTWAGTASGGHPTPDPVGGLVFGTNAFADIQSGIDALTDGGALVIYGGTYPGAVNVNKALAAIQVTTNSGAPTETLVAIDGAVTLTNSAVFTETGVTGLTFGGTVDGATPGTASLTVNGGNSTTFTGPVGNSAALASLTTGAGGVTTFTIGSVAEFGVGIGGVSASSRPVSITAGPDGNLWFSDHSRKRIDRITPAGAITEFSSGAFANSYPDGITAGPDGNVWFTELNGDRIGRITPAGVVTEYSGGITAGSGPSNITPGPDGNLWFTEYYKNRIGRITPAGVVTEFSVGFATTFNMDGITAGPDGNIWFTETNASRIGRITRTGVVTEFGAGISASSGPSNIAPSPDGNLWFTEYNGNRIGRITPSGAVTEFGAGISAGSMPYGITAGSDGNLWFTEEKGNRIGRITPAGVVTEFSPGIAASELFSITAGPDGNLWFTQPGLVSRITTAGIVTGFGASGSTRITAGPDGNLWFTENLGNRIGRITPGGTVTEFSAGLAANGYPLGITAGPDGNLWFAEYFASRIGRITPAGVITEFSAGISADDHPYGITTGSDGNLWFTDFAGNRIGRITPAGVVTEFSLPANAAPQEISAGSDGNLWFTESNSIGRITPAGVVTQFSANGGAYDIIAGPDGNLWSTMGNSIGRITPAGVITDFSAEGTALSIAAGPDGNLWFTDVGSKSIGRITPAGVVTEFTAGISVDSSLNGITAGPDSNIWFTESSSSRVGRFSAGGTVATGFNQTYNNTVVLGADTNLISTGGNVVFAGTVNGDGGGGGIHTLTVTTNSPAAQVQFNGTVGGLSRLANVTINDAGPATIAAPIVGAGTSLTKAGGGTLSLNGVNTYTGATTVSGGTLLVTGSAAASAVTITSGGTLAGNGAVGPVSNGGIVSPGASPGVLTINGNYTQLSGGALAIELNGMTVGTQYDQLSVNGTVNLSGATLAATLGSGFNPGVGAMFTIIDNDGTDAVTGTFAGLAEGAVFSIGGQAFSISYSGGTGNDVVLTRSAATAPAVVVSVIVNAGQTNLTQRSIVTNVTVTFDRIVNFTGAAESAFQLARTGPGGTLGTVVLAVDFSASTATQTVAKLTFSGALTEAGNSLVDGNYSLSVFSAQVQGGVQGGDNVSSLFRLFGDVNGDKTVNGLDLAAFRSAFGTSNGNPNYVYYLDQNGDGAINGLDLAQFRSRFGIMLP